MEFRKYDKIIGMHKVETHGILEGTCHVQEKIDGANVSIWLNEDGEIQCGSRNRHLKNEEEFNGFVAYVKGHTGIRLFLDDNPYCRLYGEWLVKHTISYREEVYKHFYLFDIEYDGSWLSPKNVSDYACNYDIKYPETFGVFDNPTIEQLTALVGKSILGVKGEGIVIKNPTFVNSFGDKVYGKLVADSFKEDAAIGFGGNDKHAAHYGEMYIANKYITLGRVTKVYDKLRPIINEPLDMKHIPRINESVYYDMLTEEIYDIQKKINIVNFNVLKRIVGKKTKQIYVAMINLHSKTF